MRRVTAVCRVRDQYGDCDCLRLKSKRYDLNTCACTCACACTCCACVALLPHSLKSSHGKVLWSNGGVLFYNTRSHAPEGCQRGAGANDARNGTDPPTRTHANPRKNATQTHGAGCALVTRLSTHFKRARHGGDEAARAACWEAMLCS